MTVYRDELVRAAARVDEIDAELDAHRREVSAQRALKVAACDASGMGRGSPPRSSPAPPFPAPRGPPESGSVRTPTPSTRSAASSMLRCIGAGALAT